MTVITGIYQCVFILFTQGLMLNNGESVFDYVNCINCIWDGLEEGLKKVSKIPDISGMMSKWPPGPYALPKAVDGCPENKLQGWEEGYIDLTFSQPHAILAKSDAASKWEDDMNITQQHRDVTLTEPPNIQSFLLGPYSKYRMKLNFCFKVRGNDSLDIGYWPNGNYSIYGGNSGCPNGFSTNSLRWQFVDVSFYTYDGHLPDFEIKQTDSNIDLVIYICTHTQDADTENDAYVYKYPFILLHPDISNDTSSSECPRIGNMVFVLESLYLQVLKDDSNATLLNRFCYFQPENWRDVNFTTSFTVPEGVYLVRTSTLTGQFPLKSLQASGRNKNLEKDERNDISEMLTNEFGPATKVYWKLLDLGRTLSIFGIFLGTSGRSNLETDTVCYYGDKKWDFLHFEAMACTFYSAYVHKSAYKINWKEKVVTNGYYLTMKRIFESRFVTLMTDRQEMSIVLNDDVEMFVLVTKHSQLTDENARCNNDMGMTDFGIDDFQITVSSFLKEFPAVNARPFHSSWCAGPDDSFPFIQVDLYNTMTIEGITIWNWEHVYQIVTNGSAYKHFLHIGTKAFTVMYGFSENNLASYSKVFRLDSTYPLEEQQTFIFEFPFVARFVQVGILEPLVGNISCLRFELHGCRKTVVRTDNSQCKQSSMMKRVPSLVNPSVKPERIFQHKTLNECNDLCIHDENCSTLQSYSDGYCVHYGTNNNENWLLDSLEGDDSSWSIKICNDDYIESPNIAYTLIEVGEYVKNFSILSYMSIIKESTILTSIGFPFNYGARESYRWALSLKDSQHMKLIFTELDLNVYKKKDETNVCKDILIFDELYSRYVAYIHHGVTRTEPLLSTDGAFVIDNSFNKKQFVVDIDIFKVLTLTFVSCERTEKLVTRGKGFRIIVRKQDLPSCSSLETYAHLNEKRTETCGGGKIMTVASMSNYNVPFSGTTEIWGIFLTDGVFLRIQMIHFDIECSQETQFAINEDTFCNLKRPSSVIYTDPGEYVTIVFTSRNKRDSFQLMYEKVIEDIPDAITTKAADVQGILQSEGFAADDNIKEDNRNIPRILYKACSEKFGKCYSLFSHLGTWDFASGECWIRRLRLLSISSLEELRLIKYLLRNFKQLSNVNSIILDEDIYRRAYIGLRRGQRGEDRNAFFWEDKSLATVYAWRKGQPSVGNCTYMGFHEINEDFSLETQRCSETSAYYFVCEAPIGNNSNAMEDRVNTGYYRGNQNITESGYTCQRWDSQFPHAHNYTHGYDFRVANVAMAENFCRDPTGYVLNLWCYTTNPAVEIDMCYLNELNEEVSPAIYKGYLDATVDGTKCIKGSGDGYNFCRNYYKVDLMENFYRHFWCYINKEESQVPTQCSYADTASDRCRNVVYSYKGMLAHTVTGKICKRWDLFISQEQFMQLQFPDEDLVEASNFCRDPTVQGFLWCYTDNTGKVWELCLSSGDVKERIESNNFEAGNIFDCHDGERIPAIKRCNGVIDCYDVSDETNCIDKVHPLLADIQKAYDEAVFINVDQRLFFRCQNYELVSYLARCDGVIDCSDATDEMDCTSLTKGQKSCEVDQFRCDDGRCIHISLVCNFNNDCIDASDEVCVYPSCTQDEYQCTSGQCIPKSRYCNAYTDCIDGTDENTCDICNAGAFHCDYVRCLPKRLHCDKFVDCSDGKDELSCDDRDMISCKAYWENGYRESGMYTLSSQYLDVLVFCDFSFVQKDNELHTVYTNIDIVEGENGEMKIFTALNGVESSVSYDLNVVVDLFSGSISNCTQEIVQRCKPAYEEAAMTDDPNHEHMYSYCACIIVTVKIATMSEIISVRYCNDSKPLDRDKIADLILFEYSTNFWDRTSVLKWREGVTIDIDKILLEIENITCKEEYDVLSTVDVVCGERSLVFNESVRCVYDTDTNGIMTACRSGSHLESCDSDQHECPVGTVKCPGSYCIPLRFVCDGVEHCQKAEDEHGCGCEETNKEVLIMYEEKVAVRNPDILQIARQLYTSQSVVRILAYKIIELPPEMNQNYKLLQINDKEFKMSQHMDRNYECEYKMLANEFLKSVKMTHENKALLFIQSSPESEKIARVMFESLENKPGMIIYRAIEEPSSYNARKELVPYINDVVVQHWRILSSLAARYLREICEEAFLTSCPGAFKCSSSKMCITLDQVCNGDVDCIHGDDEKLCGFDCPTNCFCRGYAMTCNVKSIVEKNIRKYPFQTHWLRIKTYSDVESVIEGEVFNFPLLQQLNLSSCNVKEIYPNAFLNLLNLKILDLSHNLLKKLFPLAFNGLQRLQTLLLDGNKNLETLEPFTFSFLKSIKLLKITNTKIKHLVSNTFAELTLEHLVLSGNEFGNIEEYGFGNLAVEYLSFENNLILTFDQGIFKGLSRLRTLRTPAFKYCCVRPNYLQEDNCFPSKDEFSSCEDLMRTSVLQTMLWLIGLSSLLGNVLSIIYRLKFDRERLKLGYGIFVTNLAIADFLMGVYLIIIAIADAVFRNRYIFMDDYWRGSFWCTFAGVLSTLSSESSVMFLCLITLDRILVIKYPFGQVRFDTKKALICSLTAWLLCLLISLFPLMYSSYFKGSFYTKSGVCIALPLTRDRPPGWLYSVLVFVVFNFITFLLIAVGQWSIFMDIQKQGKGFRKGQASRKRDLVIARNLLFVVGTDFLCWFPIGCVGMMALSGRVISGDVYAWSAVFVLPINSALNPILYTLTAIIGKKSFAPRADEQTQRTINRSHGKRFLMIKHVVTRRFSRQQIFVADDYQSVEDVLKTPGIFNCKVVLKSCYQLAQTLSVLHTSSLVMGKIDDKSIFLGIDGKMVQGDLQIRKDPITCKLASDLCNEMYEFGVFVRKLMRKI